MGTDSFDFARVAHAGVHVRSGGRRGTHRVTSPNPELQAPFHEQVVTDSLAFKLAEHAFTDRKLDLRCDETLVVVGGLVPGALAGRLVAVGRRRGRPHRTGEPEILTASERLHDPTPDQPNVRYSHERRRVEIFAGESGYSEVDPLTIEAERLTTVADVARWMAIVAAEPWTRSSERFLIDLGSALVAAFHENDGGAAT